MNTRGLAVIGRKAPSHPLGLVAPETIGGPVEELVRYGVSGFDTFTPTRRFASADIEQVRKHRLVQLVRLDWVEHELQQAFRSERYTVAVNQLKLESELISVLELFDVAGIESRVLKGLATGALDYPRPGMRQTGDVDLLIRQTDLQEAVKVLAEIGFQPDLPVRNDPKSVTLRNGLGIELDLHLRLARDHRSVEPLWDLDPIPFGSSPIRWALPTEARLVHAAGHLWWTPIGMRRLSGLVDVCVLSQRVDLDDTLSLAQSLGLAEACWFGMSIASELNWVEPPSWPKPGRLERAAFGSARRRPNAERFLTMVRAPDGTAVLDILQEAARRRKDAARRRRSGTEHR